MKQRYIKPRPLADCGGQIHKSFDRMLSRYYGIPMPKSQNNKKFNCAIIRLPPEFPGGE